MYNGIFHLSYAYPYSVLRRNPSNIPDLYFEYTSNDRMIAELTARMQSVLKELSGYLTIEDFNKWLETYVEEQIKQSQDLVDYTDGQIQTLKDYLLGVIEEIVIGTILVWDPSTGTLVNASTALSNSYNDLRYFAMTWEEWDEYTENMTCAELDEQLSQYTVRQVDLFSRILLKGDSTPR